MLRQLVVAMINAQNVVAANQVSQAAQVQRNSSSGLAGDSSSRIRRHGRVPTRRMQVCPLEASHEKNGSRCHLHRRFNRGL